MPKLNVNIDKVGTGFASFLSPPGPEVIRFTVGQPDFDTPSKIVDSAKASLDRGETAYTRTQGSPELCQAVSEHLTVMKSILTRTTLWSLQAANRPFFTQ